MQKNQVGKRRKTNFRTTQQSLEEIDGSGQEERLEQLVQHIAANPFSLPSREPRERIIENTPALSSGTIVSLLERTGAMDREVLDTSDAGRHQLILQATTLGGVPVPM